MTEWTFVIVGWSCAGAGALALLVVGTLLEWRFHSVRKQAGKSSRFQPWRMWAIMPSIAWDTARTVRRYGLTLAANYTDRLIVRISAYGLHPFGGRAVALACYRLAVVLNWLADLFISLA